MSERVEERRRPLGCLVSAHRLRLADDVEVELAPDRLGQRSTPVTWAVKSPSTLTAFFF
jgi:hypothetical protein